eukprot:m.295425 g.295425  ORF g.295425 m.295425 type:complete len:663 (-) comp15854_c1_seq2:2505-4493(-)
MLRTSFTALVLLYLGVAVAYQHCLKQYHASLPLAPYTREELTTLTSRVGALTTAALECLQQIRQGVGVDGEERGNRNEIRRVLMHEFFHSVIDVLDDMISTQVKATMYLDVSQSVSTQSYRDIVTQTLAHVLMPSIAHTLLQPIEPLNGEHQYVCDHEQCQSDDMCQYHRHVTKDVPQDYVPWLTILSLYPEVAVQLMTPQFPDRAKHRSKASFNNIRCNHRLALVQTEMVNITQLIKQAFQLDCHSGNPSSSFDVMTSVTSLVSCLYEPNSALLLHEHSQALTAAVFHSTQWCHLSSLGAFSSAISSMHLSDQQHTCNEESNVCKTGHNDVPIQNANKSGQVFDTLTKYCAEVQPNPALDWFLAYICYVANNDTSWSGLDKSRLRISSDMLDTANSCWETLPLLSLKSDHDLILHAVKNQIPFGISHHGFDSKEIELQLSRARILRHNGDMDVSVSSIPYGEVFGVRNGLATFQEYFDYLDSLSLHHHNKDCGKNNHKNSWSFLNLSDCVQNELCERFATSPPLYVFDHSVLSKPEFHGLANLPPKLMELLGHAHNHTLKTIPQLFVGPECSGSPMHFHGDALNFLATGSKLWFLRSPVHPTYSKQHPLHSLFPLSRTNQDIVCTQLPGDLIFVPRDWSHATLNLELTAGFAVEIAKDEHF